MKRNALVALLAAICGCAPRSHHAPTVPAAVPPLSQAQEEAALASALEQVHAKKADYKICGADLLEITVYQQAELDRRLRVSQNGEISFPLVGVVKLSGLSITEAEAALSTRLKDYLVSPQITIFIREYGNKKVFILGEVNKPGSYELPTEAKLTVLEAVTLAGGFTQIAAPDRTRIIRSVNGRNQSIPIEVSAITKRGEKDKDVHLEPNDVIFVPQSYF